MCESMADIQSAAAEIRPGKGEERKKKERRKNNRPKISWPALLHRAAIKSMCFIFFTHSVQPTCTKTVFILLRTVFRQQLILSARFSE